MGLARNNRPVYKTCDAIDLLILDYWKSNTPWWTELSFSGKRMNYSCDCLVTWFKSSPIFSSTKVHVATVAGGSYSSYTYSLWPCRFPLCLCVWSSLAREPPFILCVPQGNRIYLFSIQNIKNIQTLQHNLNSSNLQFLWTAFSKRSITKRTILGFFSFIVVYLLFSISHHRFTP